MIDLQKLIAQADHHIKRGDGMHMDPEVVKALATIAKEWDERVSKRLSKIAPATYREEIELRAQALTEEIYANDQRWRHFLGFLTDSDRAVDFHERFPGDRVPTAEEYVAAIDADRAAHIRHLQATLDPSRIQVAGDGNVTLGTPKGGV